VTAVKDKAEKAYQEARWALGTVIDASDNEAQEHLREVERQFAAAVQKLRDVERDAARLVRQWKQRRRRVRGEEVSGRGGVEEDLLRALQDRTGEAEGAFARLRRLIVPRYFKGIRPFWLFVVLWLAAVPALLWFFPSGWVLGKYHWALVATAGALLVCTVVSALLYAWAALRVGRRSRPLWQSVADAGALARRCEQAITGAKQRQAAQLAQFAKRKERHERDLAQAESRYRRILSESKERQEKELRQAEEKYQRVMAQGEERHDAALRQAEVRHRQFLAQSKERHDHELSQARETYTTLTEENRARHEAEWQSLAAQWSDGIARVEEALGEVQGESARLFPDWDDPAWGQWVPPTAAPSGIRFGEVHVGPDRVPGLVPEDHRLPPGPGGFALPAFLPLPRQCSMLFKGRDDGRAEAVQALQAVMLRLLTAVPPGKVRFTIIDPVGLGENFAAFMNLADYDDALVTSRIWTELQHIEQRLTDLTEHMENVIQKYLRNQYLTIDEYNAQAGEVAEPFRILVVANFPVNFSAEAARRLVSIAASGARCGVYTLISIDTKQPLPQGFNPADLEQAGVILVWQDRQFVWKDPDFERFPLRLDAPPDADFAGRVLHRVGERAREAKRVEVPFDFVAPAPEQWWTADSRGGINVPLGRAGATKRQHLRLGHGTAQHVLIAGKTGSGKSTLLHALITNLSLLYSPEQVELYLVDFKKGVEFKTYAVHALPHARVVAVESEREFGLSVLQRLDAELKLRGDRFRELGVQDLSGYRQANGDRPTPRVLLIVDEFQEFFVEDDKIAQEAALLLDRLVRQGRAFGIHVHLGSQTLGGAYSLARSTIDQMAVRIVLQCSEADGHLALSKDNGAARLLSRPGEAIYNDANGLLEGNNPFQVVWLSDERHEEYLRQIRELARRRQFVRPEPQIVFEGSAPADLGKNPWLHQLLVDPSWRGPAAGRLPPRTSYAWLGEAMAIKDPTAAVIRPQTGSNVLILGQQEEPAVAVMVAAVLSLAAQQAPTGTAGQIGVALFQVLDANPPDSLSAGVLGRLAGVLPHSLPVAGWHDLPKVMAEVAAEVDRRQKAHAAEEPSLYLFVHGLQRFRDLRRQEDDFGYSRRGEDKAASPAKQFTTVLRDGPAVGVHTILWCDSLNNLNRVLDRQGLREFDLRVLFQISAADSSTLIDTPLASKLGLHRALYYSEEYGQPEKFRPYGLPSDEWLEWVKGQLQKKLA
jgi:hypothetical protein